MTEPVKKYQRTDKNQAKIDSLSSALTSKVHEWLSDRPTGKLVLSAEIHANQGGLGDVYVEQTERGKI